MSLPDSERKSPFPEVDEPSVNIEIPPETDPQRSLQILKHIIDYYMNQPLDVLSPRNLHSCLPTGVSLDTWRDAVRYASDRSRALNGEIVQLRSRVAELVPASNSELLAEIFQQHHSGLLRPVGWWIDVASMSQLKKMMVDMIQERRKKADEMERLNGLVVRHGAVK